MAQQTPRPGIAGPERRELAERFGPPALRVLSWMLAAMVAAPTVLVLLLPLII